jgi:Outer membrane lipoprotein-sorting protein
MTAHHHVKWGLILAATFSSAVRAPAQDEPDAKAILKTVRVAQAAQNRTVTGRLRTAGKSLPFTLKMDGNTVRWDFSDPPQTLLLRLGENDARLEEIDSKGTTKIRGARLDDKVRDSDISYEDLSLHFLYWPDAVIEGEQTMVLQKCWIVRVRPPAKNESQYGKVKLWISKADGALMQAEAYDRTDRFARRFKVLSGQKTSDGLWMLKQMRIEAANPLRRTDFTPTYLEIDKPKD